MRARLTRLALGLVAAAGLAACASDPSRLALGTERAQVLQTLGQPTAQYRLNGQKNLAEGLQYSFTPMGQAVYNVDLNAQAQVVAVTQSIDESQFPRIEVDKWTREDVLREFGRPFEVSGVHAFKGEVWTWRYRMGPWNRLLHIYIDPSGRVTRYHTGPDLTRQWMRW